METKITCPVCFEGEIDIGEIGIHKVTSCDNEDCNFYFESVSEIQSFIEDRKSELNEISMFVDFFNTNTT